MDLQLQPLAHTCFVTGQAFADGDRVLSVLVRVGQGTEVLRRDLHPGAVAQWQAEGPVVCRWTQVFKPRARQENSDRTLKLTAESLFLALADPSNEPTAENARLLQFLAVMLERKRLLRPKGRTADGARDRFEHAKSKQLFEIPAVELTPAFFAQVQEQLGVLVGSGSGGAGASPAP